MTLWTSWLDLLARTLELLTTQAGLGAGLGVVALTRFLWVADLAKPAVLLAIVAGLTTAVLALAAPEMPEQMRVLMMILPAVCLAFTALHFGSAIALYWTTSNLFAAGQTLAARWFVARQPAAPSAVH